jgi:methionyl-tRNA synthetase
MGANLLHEGGTAAFELVWRANAFVAERAPWKLAKDPAAAGELDAALHAMVHWLAVISVLFFPFMPGKMGELWERLGSGRAMPRLDELASLDVSGWSVAGGDPLFPRPEREPVAA